MSPSSDVQEVLLHISGITMFSTEEHVAEDDGHSQNTMVLMIDHQMASLRSVRDSLSVVNDTIYRHMLVLKNLKNHTKHG